MKYSIFYSVLPLIILPIIFSVCAADAGQPKIMVVIPEYHMDPKDSGRIFPDRPKPPEEPIRRQRIPDPSGETEVIKILLEEGYHLVDQKQIENIRHSDQVKAVINGEEDLAKLLGQQFGADILISGEAVSQSTGTSFQGLFSTRARIEAKAIDLRTGRLLYSEGLYASALDRSEIIAEKIALQKAGAKLGQILADILRGLYAPDSSMIKIIVTGLSFKDFVAFKNSILTSIKSVKSIEQDSFVKKQAFLSVEIDTTPNLFAESIVAIDSSSFNTEIIEMSNDSLTIAVKPSR